VLGLAGLQGGLPGEVDGLDGGGRAAVVDLKCPGQHCEPDDDVGPARRPELAQAQVEGGDLAYGAPTGVAAGPRRETHAEAGGQLSLDPGVIPRAGGGSSLEQDPPVQGPPQAIACLDLVRDRHVGVQIGVTRAGVAVDEGDCDQTGDLDLAAPGRATGAGEDRVPFQPPQGAGDRALVGFLDLGGHLRRGDRPKGRDALDGGERQVVAGDGGRGLLGGPGYEPGQLPGPARRAFMLVGEHRHANLGADPGANIGRDRGVAGNTEHLVVRPKPGGDLDPEGRHPVVDLERLPEGGCCAGLGGGVPGGDQRRTDRVRVRVAAMTEQRLHLLGRDWSLGVDPVQTAEPGPDPLTGRLALLCVELAEAGVAQVGRVSGRHLPGQVGIPVARGELVQ
jgi:hypothetical protein